MIGLSATKCLITRPTLAGWNWNQEEQLRERRIDYAACLCEAQMGVSIPLHEGLCPAWCEQVVASTLVRMPVGLASQ